MAPKRKSTSQPLSAEDLAKQNMVHRPALIIQGTVWVSAVLIVGVSGAEMRVDKRMPPDWTLDSLRALIAENYGWSGFGLARATQLDESGRPVLERATGPTEITRTPPPLELSNTG